MSTTRFGSRTSIARKPSPALLAAIFGVLGLLLVLAGVGSFIYLQLTQSAYRLISGLLLLTLGTLAGTISVGMMGYRALTREDVAAHIVVKPTGKQRFLATFRFPDGREWERGEAPGT